MAEETSEGKDAFLGDLKKTLDANGTKNSYAKDIEGNLKNISYLYENKEDGKMDEKAGDESGTRNEANGEFDVDFQPENVGQRVSTQLQADNRPLYNHRKSPDIEERVQAENDIYIENAQQEMDIKSRIAKSRSNKEKAEKGEYANPHDQLASSLRKRNTALKTELSDIIAAKKNALEEKQYVGIRRILRYVGIKAKPVSEDVALEHVIAGLVEAAEETTERKRVAKEQRERTYEATVKSLREKQKYRNSDLDLLNILEKKLEKTEEELTPKIRARDEHLGKASSSEYKGELDALIETENDNIDKLSQIMSDTAYRIEELRDNIVFYETELEDIADKETESRAYLEMAKDAYRKARRETSRIIDFKRSGPERQNLYEFIQDIANDEELFTKTGIVVKNTNGLMEEIFGIYVKNEMEEKGILSGSKMASDYVKKKEKEKNDLVEKAKMRRYLVTV